MPRNARLSQEQWERYTYARDSGHLEFINKAKKCNAYFIGNQWEEGVLALLRSQQRPAVTVNKILGTLSSIFGEQIELRNEIAFKARYGAPPGNADLLTKLFRVISYDNQMNWRRTEMFIDGTITSRGFLDIRMNFEQNIAGDVMIENINPSNVLPDPDADMADPDTWNDVMVTRWYTPDNIEVLYNKADADILRNRGSSLLYGYDSIDTVTDRFGGQSSLAQDHDDDPSVARYVRTIERQYKQLAKIVSVVNPRTGDRMIAPFSWSKDQIAAYVQTQRAAGIPVIVTEDVGHRIRWTVTADDLVLHDDWSPYRHFTIIPYFPYFRYGATVGLVENLLDPQDLLNKSTSQELHVVNTTANSGWKVKRGSLLNMTTDELEQQGAKTGLVLELNDVADAEKITPNQIPQGLDMLSRKGENYIKSVSMRGDAQMGMTRADVSADQIEANNVRGEIGLLPALDSLKRTDHWIARSVLSLVQEYYTDHRIMTLTKDELTGDQEDIQINWPDPTTGEIQNDITLGRYDINVISQPARQTLETSQFEQAVMLKEKLGIPIPNEFIIQNSNLLDKTRLIQALREAAKSAEAEMQKKIQLMAQELELANMKAEAARLEAVTLREQATAAKTTAETQVLARGEPGEQSKAQMEMALDEEKHQQKMRHEEEMARLKLQIKQEEARLKRAQEMIKARNMAKKGDAEADAIRSGKAQPQGNQGDKAA